MSSAIHYPGSLAPARETDRRSSFHVYAWGVLGYNLLVIMWGAFVRATGSGAGCGSHWPLCNGDVVPRAPEAATMIEFTHRLTSGLALIAVVALVWWAVKSFPKKHRVRYGAYASLFFILVEAALGAGLVLLRYVADDASIGRAFYLSAHLINTMMLVGALALTAWWASGWNVGTVRNKGRLGWVLGGGVALMLLLGVSGAVAALGDTLFPSASLREGLREDFSATAHFLIRLRVLHPVIAIVTSVFLIVSAGWIQRKAPHAATSRWGKALLALVVIQLVAGLVNLLLLAPVWMQLIHLLLSELMWIAFVLLGAAAMALPWRGQTGPERVHA